jgi:hypothetical protein
MPLKTAQTTILQNRRKLISKYFFHLLEPFITVTGSFLEFFSKTFFYATKQLFNQNQKFLKLCQFPS